MREVEDIRKDFPILRKRRDRDDKLCIYLDNTATSLKPKQVVDSIVDYYENHCANIHRGVYRLSQEASRLYEEAHDVVARFIGAENRTQMSFVKNTTEAINYVAYGIDWRPGDTVITSIMEHHSNIVPWHLIREKFGIKIKYLNLKDDWYLDVNQLEELMDDRTRLVTITHISNVLGTINPVEEICKIAHDHKAFCLIDAAQAVPHMPVDVKKIGCDFLVFSAHKMLGPTGIGGLYIKEGIAEELCPTLGGGEMIRNVTMESSEWNIMPWKFEAGTPNIAGGIGFKAAIDYLNKLDMKWVRNHEMQLTEYLLEKLATIPKVEIYGPQDIEKKGGVVAFNIKGLDAHDVATFLDEIENIAVRSGLHCAQPLHKTLGVPRTVRASVYIYNTKEEITKLCDTLKVISDELA